jgi:molybdopterin converting factor small subunit
MSVGVKLFGLLRRYGPDSARRGAFSIKLAPDTTVGELLAELGISGAVPVVAMVNSAVRGLDHVLVDGDQLYLFPPVSGG